MKAVLPLSVICSLLPLLASALSPSHQGFIENKGQLRDQHGRPAPQVHYLWPTGKGVNVQVLSDGLSYDTYAKASATDGPVAFHRMDMRFVGAASAAGFTVSGTHNDRMHFIDRDGHPVRDVRHHDGVRINGLYKDIDLDIRIASDGGLKYDILLRSGADLGKVRMEFAGYDDVRVGEQELVFSLSGKQLVESIPASWTGPDKQPVHIAYRIIEQRNGHLVLGLERSDPVESPRIASLTVDPAVYFAWSTYHGGELADAVNGVAHDDVGFMYVAGCTGSFATLVTTGGFQSTYGGGLTDAFISKIAPQGSRLWTSYFGNEGEDEALGISVDGQFNTRVVGRTTSDQGIATDSVAQNSYTGGQDGFLALFDSSGSLVWSTYIGGGADDAVMAVKALSGRRTCLCGTTSSSDLFDAMGVLPALPFSGLTDGFVACFNDSGLVTRATFLGGAAEDGALAITVDVFGVAYVAGYTSSELTFTEDLLQGGSDGFFAAVDTNGTIQWARLIGGSEEDVLTGIALRQGSLGLCGYTASMGLADSSAVQDSLRGAYDALVLRTDLLGELLGITYFGGPGDDRAFAIGLDWYGGLFIAGTTTSASDLTGVDPTLDSLSGPSDAFLAYFIHTDSLVHARYFGGDTYDAARAISLYGATMIGLAGSTTSTEDFASSGFQVTSGGEEDGMIARFNTDRSTPPLGICSGSPNGACTPGGCSAWNPIGGGNYEPPPMPQMAVCLGDTVTFCTSGGALAYGHYWMWYADDCGEPQHFLGIGSCVTFIAQQSFMLWVRSESAFTTGYCTGLSIIVDPYPIPFATAPDHVCAGDSIPLSGGGGSSYFWEGPPEFSAAEAEVMAPSDELYGDVTFTLTVFSAYGCARQAEVAIQVTAVQPMAWNVVPVTCFGGADGSITADTPSAAGHTFQWLHDGSEGLGAMGLSAGEYIVLMSDTMGCVRSDTLLVTQPVEPLDSIVTTRATCGRANGAAIVLLNPDAGPFTCEWTAGSGTGTTVSGLLPGAYGLQLSNVPGCVFAYTFTVLDTGAVSISVYPDLVTIYLGEQVELDASFMPFDPMGTLYWTPSDGLSCSTCADPVASPQADAQYVVEVTNSLGCTATDTALVFVVIPPVPAFFLPTHFSPNGDGLNDLYMPLGGAYTRMRIIISDRDGHEVFVADDVRPEWDGAHQGRPAPLGTYTVLIEAERSDGNIDHHHVQLQLMR